MRWTGSANRTAATSTSAPAPSTWPRPWPDGADSGDSWSAPISCKPMLERGRGKAARVSPVNADALDLPLADASCDGATVGFGMRNLSNLEAGLAEAARVLRPGARFVILEFTTPPRQPMRALYFLYFRHLLPEIGRLVSKHRSAYRYLPQSVLAFPGPGELAANDARQRISRCLLPPAAGWHLRHPHRAPGSEWPSTTCGSSSPPSSRPANWCGSASRSGPGSRSPKSPIAA